MSDTYVRKDDIRRIQEAIAAGDEMNGWRQIYAEIDQWIRGRDYFFGYDDAFFAEIGPQSGHGALNQEAVRGGYVRLYQMANGETIADIEQASRADRLTATNNAVRFLMQHSFNNATAMPPDDTRSMYLREIGGMYYRASKQLMKEQIPQLDWKNPEDAARGLGNVIMLGKLSDNFVQLKQGLNDEKDFYNEFWGLGALKETDDRMNAMAAYGECVREAFNPSASQERRIGARMALEQYGQLFAGKTLQSLPASAELAEEIKTYMITAEVKYGQMSLDQQTRIEQYLTGQEEKPEELFGQVLRSTQEYLLQNTFRRADDASLRTAETRAFQGLQLFMNKSEQPRIYFALRQQSGELGKTAGEQEDAAREKREIIEEGNLSFLATCRRMGLDMSHPMYGMAGCENAEDLFYIDGIPAKEYVEKLYPGQNLTAAEDSRKLLRAEIVSAVLSGEHHVEAAKLGISQDGDYEIGVVEVRLDDKLLDGQERFYQTKPSRKAEKFYSSDKTGRERKDAIRGKVSERFAAAAAKRINETEYQKHPHAAAAKKFSQDNGERTYDYFDDLALGQLNWISVDSFLTRQSFDILRDFREDRKPFGNNFTAGNFKGFRVLAQLKLLADHPEIRVADLMDPARYGDEKKEAGGLVSEACVRYFMGPQETDLNDREYMVPLAEIVRSAMGVIGNMDVRKELLYALGEPMNLEGDQAISVMEKPENLLYVNSFLSSLNDLSLTGKMVFSTMAGEKAYTDVSKLDPEKADSYPPVYAELLKGMDPEMIKNYKAADRTLTALSGENSWNQAIAGYMRGEYSMKNPKDFQMMETEALTGWVISSYMREKIADYGKAAAIPEAADMAEIANIDSWQHRLLGRHVGEAMKNKKLSMAEQMTAASAPGESRQWVAGILSEMEESRKTKGRGDSTRVKVGLSEMERAGRPEKKKPLSEDPRTHSAPKKEHTRKP